jgi:hypothetical protein
MFMLRQMVGEGKKAVAFSPIRFIRTKSLGPE